MTDTSLRPSRRRLTALAATAAAVAAAGALLSAPNASAAQPWDGMKGHSADEFGGTTLNSRWDTKRDCCGEINGGFQEKGPSPAGANPNRFVSGGYLHLKTDYGTSTPTGSYVEEESGRPADGDTSDRRCFPASSGGCAWAIRWKATNAAAGSWQGGYIYGRDDVTELNFHEVDPALAPNGKAVQATHIWGNQSAEPDPNYWVVPINPGGWNESGIKIAADGTVTRYMNGVAAPAGKVKATGGYHVALGNVPHGPGTTEAEMLVDWVRHYRGK